MAIFSIVDNLKLDSLDYEYLNTVWEWTGESYKNRFTAFKKATALAVSEPETKFCVSRSPDLFAIYKGVGECSKT